MRIKIKKIFYLIVLVIVITILGTIFFVQKAVNGKKPNIAVLLLDCVRPDHLGCYGYTRSTSPHIDELAKNGCVFNFAISQAPWTASSVASLFTGCYPATHGAGVSSENEMFKFEEVSSVRGPLEPLTLMAEFFAENGYKTHFYSSNLLVHEKFYKRGCQSFVCKCKAKASTLIDYAIENIQQAVATEKPFFLYLHFMDSHEPLRPPEPYFNFFRFNNLKNKEVHIKWSFGKPAEQKGPNFSTYREQKICLYDGSIRYSDEQIGRLAAEIKNRRLMEDTIFVILADHGEEFWDHAKVEATHYHDPREISGIGHGHTLFQELLHVPLIFAGVRTFKESDDDRAPVIFSEFPAYGALRISLIQYPLKYIFSLGEQDFLFNIQEDEEEKENLLFLKQEEASMLLKEIEKHYEQYSAHKDRKAEPLGKDDIEKLKSLGYIN